MSHLNLPIFKHQSKPSRGSIFLVQESEPKQITKESLKSENEDLFASMRNFIRFGRIIGVIPLKGVWGKDSKGLNFRWASFPALSSLIIIMMLSTNVIVGFVSFFHSSKRTASDVAVSSASPIFYAMGLFVYAYLLQNAEQFVSLFKKWRTLKQLHFNDEIGDTELFDHVNLIAGITLTSAILENLLLFLLQSEIIPPPIGMNGTFLENYFKKSHSEWKWLYDGGVDAPFMGAFVFISNRLNLYAWNFGDLLIILFARGLYCKFKRLNQVAEQRLLIRAYKIKEKDKWIRLTQDHKTLCDLLSEFSNFLSPLIFASYSINIFYICIQIRLGFTRDVNVHFLQGVYTVWSFLHLILRVFMKSVSAARINTHAHAIKNILQLCTPQAYSLEVRRLEHLLGTSVIGLDGLGCFVITKPFLLTIVGVVFTIQIVLLQNIN